MNRKKIYPFYLAVLPLTIFFVFFILPSTVGYFYAFTNWSAARTKNLSFVGLTNILSVIQNRKLPVAFGNTIIYTVVKTVLVTLLGFVFAYMLNKDIRHRTFLRTLYFIPSVLSCLVVGLIFGAVFQTRHGILNNILNAFGIDNIQWLGKRTTAVSAICMTEIWRNTGFAIIITLAGMQSVSSEYIEAGRLDGASEWQMFKNIILPIIMPTVNINILFSLIHGLKMFDLIEVMTGGGPGNATESLGTLVMTEMSEGRYAQSVAVNLVFSVFLFAVSWLYSKFSARWETVL